MRFGRQAWAQRGFRIGASPGRLSCVHACGRVPDCRHARSGDPEASTVRLCSLSFMYQGLRSEK